MGIAGSQPTLIQDARGQVSLARVGELVDEHLARQDPSSAYSILSLDQEIGMISFRPIKELLRVKQTEPLMHIRTRYNRSIMLTQDHHVLLYDQGQLLGKRACEVRRGDLLVASRRLPRPGGGAKRIDLVETLYRGGQTEALYLKGEDVRRIAGQRVLGRVQRPELWEQPKVALSAEGWQPLIAHRQALGLTQMQVAAAIGVKQPITISHWERGIYRPIRPHFEAYLDAIGWEGPLEYELVPSKIEERLAQDDSSRHARWRQVSNYKLFEEFTPEEIALLGHDVQLVPQAHVHKAFGRYLPITQELMWFLGWYVAEGTLSAHQVSLNLGHKDERFIPELIQTVEQVFGETPRRYNDPDSNGIKFYFHSVASARLLKAWDVARKAHEKKLPDLVFNLSQELQLAFIEGYFLGDGTLNGQVVSLTTNSPLLKDGILFLLGQLGLITSITQMDPSTGPAAPIQTRHRYYTLSICGKGQLDSCHTLWHRHANADLAHQHLAKSGHKAMSFTPVGEELMGLEVLAVEHIEGDGEHVYDLRLEDGASLICGVGGLVVGG